MSTQAGAEIQHAGRAGEREGFPTGGTAYDWMFAIISALFIGGIYLVGWATTHNSTVLSIFTPWYAVLFAGFVLLLAYLVFAMLRYHAQGYPWKRALPQSYFPSLLGLLLFVVALAGTQFWQALSVSLTGLETLLLPTTLVALLGAVLIVSGPLRAGWLRFPINAAPNWIACAPLLLSIAWILSICTFATQFAHPFVQAYAASAPAASTVFSDIYTMHADGTAQTRLTFAPQRQYFSPSWSLDGHKIAFALGPGSGPTNLYVMKADGTNPIQLTHLALTCYLPQWSPDGSELVFIAQQGNNVNAAAVYTINADGSNLRRLTHENTWEYGAVWSPDGTQIAFGSRSEGTWHVYVMNADGSNMHVLTSMSGNKPSWSPDGRFIVFTSDVSGHNDLYVMNADGSNVRLLTMYGDHAAWSPDGQHIAFESNRTGNQEIYSMNADGSGITNLTRNPGVDNQLPEWSPDSHEIVYMTQRQVAQPGVSLAQSLGITSIIIQAALLMGFILLLIRRWKLPFGALTLIITLNGLLLSALGDQYMLLPAALLTSLVADLLIWQLHPSVEHPVPYTLFACSVPVIWSALYFLALSLTQRVVWSLPLVTGSIILAGLTGLVLSFAFRLPLYTGGRP